jgi:hypothetical protein
MRAANPPRPHRIPYAVDVSLLDLSQQQVQYVRSPIGIQPATQAAFDAAHADTADAQLVLDGIWKLAQQLDHRRSVGLHDVRLATTDQGYASNLYAARLAHDALHPPTIRSFATGAIGAQRPTRMSVGTAIRDNALRSTSTRAETVYGTSISFGPKASEILLRRMRGGSVSADDAAYAARVVAHEVAHSATDRAHFGSAFEEGVAELVARNPRIARSSLQLLGLPSTPDMVQRAVQPLGELLHIGQRALYDDHHHNLTQLLTLAGMDPQADSTIRLLLDNSGEVIEDRLVTGMLQKRGLPTSPTNHDALLKSVHSSLLFPVNDDSPPVVLDRLAGADAPSPPPAARTEPPARLPR